MGDPSSEVHSLLGSLREGGFALAPCLWPIEVCHTIRRAERLGHLTQRQVAGLVEVLKALPVQVENQTPLRVFDTSYELAARHNLSVYDATYLELALRRGHPLASLDKQLRRASSAVGVAVLPAEV